MISIKATEVVVMSNLDIIKKFQEALWLDKVEPISIVVKDVFLKQAHT